MVYSTFKLQPKLNADDDHSSEELNAGDQLPQELNAAGQSPKLRKLIPSIINISQ